MSRHNSAAPMSPGVHFLSAHAVIRQLIRSSGVGPGDLVIDFGAGPGTLTAPLAATGCRILAVERDEAFVRKLRRRFADQPLVRVVHADLRTVALPSKDFSVVANIPYAVSTLLLRRLLSRPRRSLAGADLVVEWGFARRVVSARTKETALWATRYDLRVARRIPASCFRPAPRVDSAHLVIRRKP
jgi:16S rRNA A1518/A1519 N6-dimethyltransferase RsmA/KsgA/DIM1 with predicted DNA glycosylase/AP lyase activity